LAAAVRARVRFPWAHKRVRPSETLEDQKLIQVEYADEVAVRLDLAVTGQDATENINTWDTMAIVSLLPD
jgi:hypothetical protein